MGRVLGQVHGCEFEQAVAVVGHHHLLGSLSQAPGQLLHVGLTAGRAVTAGPAGATWTSLCLDRYPCGPAGRPGPEPESS